MSAKNSSRFLAVLVLGTAGLFVIHHHRPAPRSADMGAEVQSTPPAARADFTKLSRLTGGDPANPPATTFPAAAWPENIQMNTEPEAAPAWAVRYGAEFWRKPAGNRTAKASPADLALAATINLGDVIERVTHAAEVDPETGLPSVRAGRSEEHTSELQSL